MSSATIRSEADIWERVIHPRGPMSKSTARRILELSLSEQEQQRAQALAERNRRGELDPDEEGELDHLCRVGSLLSILKVRAWRVLESGCSSRPVTNAVNDSRDSRRAT